jgi:hypothetical protein
LGALVDDAIETDLAPIVRFARTLNRDFDAVKNAVEMPCCRVALKSAHPQFVWCNCPLR